MHRQMLNSNRCFKWSLCLGLFIELCRLNSKKEFINAIFPNLKKSCLVMKLITEASHQLTLFAMNSQFELITPSMHKFIIAIASRKLRRT